MKMVMRYCITALLACPLMAFANPLLTITCHDTKGSTIHYGVPFWERAEAKINHKPIPSPHLLGPKDDRYDNTLTIVVDSASPNKVTVIWNDSPETAKTRENAKKQGIDMLPPEVDEGVIVSGNSTMFTAIVDGALGAMVMYSFYPKNGTAFITTHTQAPDASDTIATTVRAACEYSGNPRALRTIPLSGDALDAMKGAQSSRIKLQGSLPTQS